MALQDVIFGAIADLTSIAINCIVKKLGYPEIKAKQIEVYLGWAIILLFVALLSFITFKYS
nr:hypothetical protein [uncultured Methylotenera sp.]